MRVVLGYLPYIALAISADTDTFEDFIIQYSKVYNSPKEYEIAKRAFEQNMKTIDQLRKSSEIKHEVGINEFSDMPEELFAEMMTYDMSSHVDVNATVSEGIETVGDLPASIDWAAAGALGPVREQKKSCDSCYAVAACAVMESRFKLKTGISKVVQFSVQQIVDCSRPSGNFGCLGGQSLYAYDYAKAQGMVKESSYPYKAKESACKTSITSNPEKQCLKKGDINQLLPIDRHDELKMMEALTTGPVTASICATCPAFKAYKSGILTAAACGKGDVDHTITMVGYGTASDGTPYWKIMNSWGKSWGMKGFALLQRTGPSIPRDTCGVLAGNHLYPVYADTVMSSVCAKK